MSKVPLFIFFRLFLTFSVAVPSRVISETEQTILLTLKRELGDPPSLRSWKPSPSAPCDWTEIGCSGSGGAVTKLVLASKGITTTKSLPSTICNLKHLLELNLFNNSIAGEFPTTLYECSNLRYLNLSQNYLSGAIPADVDRLKNLTFLDLTANSFSGEIPAAIGNLRELQTLHLSANNFEGTVPKEIGNLSNLEFLGLAYNLKLAPWEFPLEFRKLRKLKSLYMPQCNLIGEIPEYFGDIFTNLERLDLGKNKLSGSIPRNLFSLRKLGFLYLFSNRLSGVIPSATMQCLELIDLDFAKNNLTGSIPPEFGKLKNLSTLHLYENHLFGEIPVSLSQIPSLIYFRVFSNNLSGTLPPELGLHSKLTVFEVSENQLSGGLPEHLCAGGALIGVVAFSNNFSGILPEWIGNCPSLATVQLYNNKFSGEIPLGLWTMNNLSSLILSNNSFSGPLPSQVFWNMTRIEIANNNFSGGISVGITSAKNLMFLDARNNMLSGEIPRELTQLSQLTALMLDGNQLSGALPSEIISWQSLNILTLSRNKLSGEIPTAITALPRLAYLDLCQNSISGEIPPQFDRLRFVFLNLSSNQLSGKIPDEFNNLAFENSFLNNPLLCAYNPNVHLDNCFAKTVSAAPQSSNSSSKSLALVLAATAVVLVAIASLVFYTLKTQWGKKHCGQKNKVATWRLTSFQRVDLTEINFLSSLTDNNLIGSGGFGKVYRIASNRPGEYVAVKQIWNREDVDDKLEKEFQAEVEILGNIRHSNIVKLLCCYASENSKLLVYEYMENQSLDKWLHAEEKKSPPGLSWPTRLNIAIGAAQGLCYMHHECSPPVIHRDVKSSNILLDSEFRAKIADFGLAKMLAKPGELNTMSALAGSFGYIPPEYAYSTKINEKVDVYSFGVVLLELVTGRKPNISGERECSLVEWAWEHFNEAKSLTDAFDEDIKEPRYAEEMANVFKLGLLCTASLPSTRPSTKEILQVLRCCHSGSTRRRMGNEFDIAPLLGDTRYVCSYKESNAATNNSS
ncbi:receptor-like protein kinase HSL1 [Vigna unguiculata]|uniref:Leucine-rich repeat family protein n=1 Tax=Vigna unguiculata TaxID=3917 RepID=A0A4D6NU51_VIGUN|nr:receptor-like protein kinase HSL1 [Vigna unguiculata]QCE16039.1 leucine-rich repeat family protein [Vigna unguiculata]